MGREGFSFDRCGETNEGRIILGSFTTSYAALSLSAGGSQGIPGAKITSKSKLTNLLYIAKCTAYTHRCDANCNNIDLSGAWLLPNQNRVHKHHYLARIFSILPRPSSSDKNQNVWNMRRTHRRSWTREMKLRRPNKFQQFLWKFLNIFPFSSDVIIIVQSGLNFPLRFSRRIGASPLYPPSPRKINFTPLRGWGVILKNRVYPENNLESAAAVGSFSTHPTQKLISSFS